MDVFDIGKAGFSKLARESHNSFLDLVKESDELFGVVKAEADKQLGTSSTSASSSQAHSTPSASASSSTSAKPPPWTKSSSATSAAPPSSSAAPWPPASSAASSSGAKRKNSNYTYEQVLDLRAEESVARELGLRWQDRGPMREHHDSDTWRGQQWRESSGRWGNRGGVARDWYVAFYKAKRQGPQAMSDFLANNPKPTKQ